MSNSPEAAIAWRVDLTVPEHLRVEIETLLEDHVAAVLSTLLEDFDEIEVAPELLWRLSVYCADEAEGAALASMLAENASRLRLAEPDITGTAVPPEDWVAKNAQKFPLIFAGRFVVHGDHLRPPPGRMALCISAGNAFGSGMHGSTRGCLLALDGIAHKHQVRRALDLGAGSGILAVAIATCWADASVLASDIDPAAVAGSNIAAEENGVADRLQSCLSDGFAANEVCDGAPYDLICANILANPLCQLAADVAQYLAPGGLVILSGLLTRQEDEVGAAYQRARLRLADQIRLGDWSTLLLTN